MPNLGNSRGMKGGPEVTLCFPWLQRLSGRWQYEILRCVHSRLINEWFCVAPEEKVTCIEIWRKWNPINGSHPPNLPHSTAAGTLQLFRENMFQDNNVLCSIQAFGANSMGDYRAFLTAVCHLSLLQVPRYTGMEIIHRLYMCIVSVGMPLRKKIGFIETNETV